MKNTPKFGSYGDEFYEFYTVPEVLALTFGHIAKDTERPVSYIVFKPSDFHLFLMFYPELQQFISMETQRKLIDQGVVGYMWGATMVLDPDVDAGTIVVSSANREKIMLEKDGMIVDTTIWNPLYWNARKHSYKDEMFRPHQCPCRWNFVGEASERHAPNDATKHLICDDCGGIQTAEHRDILAKIKEKKRKTQIATSK